MWMGLTARSANAAFFYTIVLLVLTPIIPSCFVPSFGFPVGWLLIWGIAAAQISGSRVRRMLLKQSGQFFPAPTPIPPVIR
jgi:hypothetical protein